MAWTTKLLVIANQTIDSEELHAALAARAQRGPLSVTLMAPASRDPGDVLTGRQAAQTRLDAATERLRAAGVVKVEAMLGSDPDPLVALADMWDPRRFDEIIVSTLPGKLSRWLQFDLPHRIAAYTDAQVSHVIAQPRVAARPTAPSTPPARASEVLVSLAFGEQTRH